MSLPFDPTPALRAVPMTVYTEQLIVRGTLLTAQHRVTDILNLAQDPYLVLEDATLEEHGSTAAPARAEFAQVALASVLLAVSLTAVEPVRELRRPKVSERAFLSVPPFRIVGNVHLLPDRGARVSLAELHGAFIPVTDATFWSERVDGLRQAVAFVAVNHARTQVLAPFREAQSLPDGSAMPPEPPKEP
jgi:hypothetical protein